MRALHVASNQWRPEAPVVCFHEENCRRTFEQAPAVDRLSQIKVSTPMRLLLQL